MDKRAYLVPQEGQMSVYSQSIQGKVAWDLFLLQYLDLVEIPQPSGTGFVSLLHMQNKIDLVNLYMKIFIKEFEFSVIW
jgi:hypothetical protein